MSKHIVIDAREIRSTTGRYIVNLLRNLEKIDTINSYAVLIHEDDSDYWQPSNSNFKCVFTRYSKFSFGEQLGLYRQLKSIKPDLVHFTMVQQPLLYRDRFVTSMLDLTGLRFAKTNNPVSLLKKYIYYFVNRKAAKHSRRIITISNFVKNDVSAEFKISPEKITTTYNAADKIAEQSQPIKLLHNERFIMYVGRPQAHKNLERLLEAFVLIQKTHPNLKLVLAGKKDVLFDRHEERAKELGISDSVVFTGFVSEGQLRWLYENCQAYVFPSLSEGFGLPGLEAMMHGAPVVSSNATCLPEIYEDAAHYFDPLDIDDMAKKICEVLDDKQLREHLIKKGHSQAAKYSWQRMASQTLEVYRTALDSK